MNKIEQIKAEIDKLYGKYKDKFHQCGDQYHLGLIDGLDMAERVLDSFESENPINPDDAMKELNEKIALVKQRGTWDGVDVDKYMDEVRGREPEKPKDLEEAAKEIVVKMHPCMEDCIILGDRLTRGELTALVKAGAKWQAEQLLKSSPLPEDTVIWDDGFKTGREVGARDMKEQMMKDAVEYEVGMHGEPITVNLDKYVQRARGIFPGDKVRIIIVKEDEK